MTSRTPWRAGDLADRVEVALVGQHDADVGQRRLHQQAGDVALRQAPVERVGIVEGDDRGGLARRRPAGPAGPVAARRGRRRASRRSRRPCRGSTSPSPRSAAARSGAGRSAARTGWRRSPSSRTATAAARTGGSAPAPTQIASSDGSMVVMPGRARARDRLGHRGQRVPGHRAGVAEAEVDVLDAVDVGQAGARTPSPRRAGTTPPTASSTASGRRPAGSRRLASGSSAERGWVSTNRRSSSARRAARRSRSIMGRNVVRRRRAPAGRSRWRPVQLNLRGEPGPQRLVAIGAGPRSRSRRGGADRGQEVPGRGAGRRRGRDVLRRAGSASIAPSRSRRGGVERGQAAEVLPDGQGQPDGRRPEVGGGRPGGERRRHRRSAAAG